jgi:hypothetical protein
MPLEFGEHRGPVGLGQDTAVREAICEPFEPLGVIGKIVTLLTFGELNAMLQAS